MRASSGLASERGKVQKVSGNVEARTLEKVAETHDVREVGLWVPILCVAGLCLRYCSEGSECPIFLKFRIVDVLKL